MTLNICKMPDCDLNVNGQGLCNKHYKRALYNGLLTVNPPTMDARERLEARTERPEGTNCWLWRGSLNIYGYGRIKFHGESVFVHRLSYETLVGPIPDGLVIDHLCRVRNCVNPDHMEPVTNSENIRRGVAGLTKMLSAKGCRKHGYESGKFMPVKNRPSPKWVCSTCTADSRARSRARKAAARQAEAA